MLRQGILRKLKSSVLQAKENASLRMRVLKLAIPATMLTLTKRNRRQCDREKSKAVPLFRHSPNAPPVKKVGREIKSRSTKTLSHQRFAVAYP
jgi:hypothetical protein